MLAGPTAPSSRHTSSRPTSRSSPWCPEMARPDIESPATAGDSSFQTGRRPDDRPVATPARERPPVPVERDGDDVASGSSRRPRLPGWAPWAIWLVLIIGWNVLLAAPLGRPSAASIPYSEFVSQTASDNVTVVDFDGQIVTGSFVKPVVWPPTAETPDASQAPAESVPATPTSYQTFSTVVPPDGDASLLPLLAEHDVVVSAMDSTSMGSVVDSIVGLVGSLLPIALLVGFLVYAGRQAQ